MRIPDDLAALLAGSPALAHREQAFYFLTVDDESFPHAALLSRAELDVSSENDTIFAVIAGPGTAANLQRTRHATLISVGGNSAHYAKLVLVRSIREANLLGCAFELAWHKADNLGIPLTPTTFHATAEIAVKEHWDRSEELLNRLKTGAG